MRKNGSYSISSAINRSPSSTHRAIVSGHRITPYEPDVQTGGVAEEHQEGAEEDPDFRHLPMGRARGWTKMSQENFSGATRLAS